MRNSRVFISLSPATLPSLYQKIFPSREASGTLTGMKVVILYRPNSEGSRVVEDFAREFARRYIDKKLELVSVDTRDGSATATLYDVMKCPAVLALGDDGQIIHQWQGETMPLLNEVSYYAST